MIIIKFAMIAFLFFMAYLMVTAAERMQPKSGPNYYLNMANVGVNSIQPQYRISKSEALQRPHVFEVECYNNGEPYRVSKIDDGRLQFSTFYYVDGYGRLRYVGHSYGYGNVTMRQVSRDPGD